MCIMKSMKNKTIIIAITVIAVVLLGVLGFIVLSGNDNSNDNSNTGDTNDQQQETNANYNIVEAMNHIEPTNTIEEINMILGFESTTDPMIGNDPIWKFNSKNWISYKTSGDDNVTIQATIDKEDLKDSAVTLPSSSDLQKDLDNGSFTYEELVKKLGGEGTLTSVSKGSRSYTWVDKNGQRLGATFSNKDGKCTVASYR